MNNANNNTGTETNATETVRLVCGNANPFAPETRTAFEITLPAGRRGEPATSTSAPVFGLTPAAAQAQGEALLDALHAAGFNVARVRALDLNKLTGRGLYMTPAVISECSIA